MNSLALQMVYLGTALSINVINYLIGIAVRVASQREKHFNMSQQIRSETQKYIFAQFINTAVISFIIYASEYYPV